MSISEIARQTGRDRKTVRKIIEAGVLKETEAGQLRIFIAEQSLVAEHRLVSGRYQRVIVQEHYAGLPEPRPRRTPPLARQVIPPERHLPSRLAR